VGSPERRYDGGTDGGLRRDVTDLQWKADGVRLLVRQSNTDQEGAGMVKGIPYTAHPEYCPVRALRAWLEAVDLEAGPVFRPVSKTGTVLPRRLTDQRVALIVKWTLAPGGIRHEFGRPWSRVDEVMDQTGQKDVKTVMRCV
jgi:hypothetical protein